MDELTVCGSDDLSVSVAFLTVIVSCSPWAATDSQRSGCVYAQTRSGPLTPRIGTATGGGAAALNRAPASPASDEHLWLTRRVFHVGLLCRGELFPLLPSLPCGHRPVDHCHPRRRRRVQCKCHCYCRPARTLLECTLRPGLCGQPCSPG